MSRILKVTVICCCIVGLMSASAMAQPTPRMFVVPLTGPNGTPVPSITAYASGPTVVTASPGDTVCVGFYVQGDAAPYTSRGVQGTLASQDLSASGPCPTSGDVKADCTTVAVNLGRVDSAGYAQFVLGGLGACVGAPFVANIAVYNQDNSGETFPAAPAGVYFGEVCYNVSADACGDFSFEWDTPGTNTVIGDFPAGTFEALSIFESPALTISVRPPNDDCADGVTINTGSGADVNTLYDLECASDSGIAAACDLGNAGPPCTGDVWYETNVQCNGELSISLTGGANFAVYPEGTNCDPAASSDDFCGAAAVQIGACDNQVLDPLVSIGDSYLIRVGGLLDGTGTLTVRCDPCCTPNLPAGSATTNLECGGAPLDPCLMRFCNEGEIAGALGCRDVFVDPNNAGNNTNGRACNDVLFCTINDACAGGTCSDTDPNPSCVDENPCTIDACCETAGQIIFSNSIGDVTCAAADSCENVDINTIACANLADCPVGSTDCVGGFCVCVANPSLCLEVETDPNTNCLTGVDEGGIVTVNVMKGSGTIAICAAQLFMSYDPSCMDFLSITPGGGVFNTVIFEFVDEGAGTIDYVIGENPGAICVGEKDEVLVAVMTFQSTAACKCDGVCFRPHNPETKLGDAEGNEVCPLGHIGPPPENICGLTDNPLAAPCCTGAFSVDSTNPVVNCPDIEAFGNADCGGVVRCVNWPPITASDNCDGAIPVDCTISHNGGADVQDLLATGGCFPPGVTTIDCDGTVDSCGNASECVFSVGNSGMNGIHVDVELSPTMKSGPLTRGIEFWVTDCGPIANPEEPIVVCDTVDFGFPFHIPGHGEAQAKVPPGNWACLTARDPLHTLNATCDLSCEDVPGKGNVWYSSFKGSKNLSDTCHWLVNGNLNGIDGDGFGRIDVLDYVTYLACVANNPAPGKNTTCASTGPHCDINGDGIVSLLDFSFILVNIFNSDKAGCDALCSPTVAGVGEVGGARESITVRELVDLGYGSEARAADRNGDGLVNLTDMALYLQNSNGTVTSRDVKGTRSVRGLR